MLRTTTLILIFLLTTYLSVSQEQCYTEGYAKDPITNFCGTFENYTPDDLMITKFVNINFHILQKSVSDPHNFQQTAADSAYLEAIVSSLNTKLQFMQEPYYNGVPTGDPFVQDFKLKFVLKDIHFTVDSIAWSSYPSDSYYCYANHTVNNSSELNLFFINGEPDTTGTAGIGGIGFGLSGETSNFVLMIRIYQDYLNYPPGTYGATHLGGRPWLVNPLILHEIFHCLNLSHPTSNSALIDDLYIPQYMGACHAWDSVPANCTNNVMAYTYERDYLSPNQLASIHVDLSMGWRKKLLGNCIETDPDPLFITTNQNWDHYVFIGPSLSVSNFTDLTSSCTLHFVENSDVVIGNGSSVTLDSTTLKCCPGMSNNFEVAGSLTMNHVSFDDCMEPTMTVHPTGILTINTEIASCLDSIMDVHIMNGGQLIFNGIDYTDSIASAYCDSVVSTAHVYSLDLSPPLISPNPNSGSFEIQLPFPLSTNVEIVDILGKRVYNQRFDGTTGLLQVELPEVKTGTYFVRIEIGEQLFFDRVEIHEP